MDYSCSAFYERWQFVVYNKLKSFLSSYLLFDLTSLVQRCSHEQWSETTPALLWLCDELASLLSFEMVTLKMGISSAATACTQLPSSKWLWCGNTQLDLIILKQKLKHLHKYVLCNIGFIYEYNQHAMTDHRQVMLIGAAERNWTNSASKLDGSCLQTLSQSDCSHYQSDYSWRTCAISLQIDHSHVRLSH